MLPSNLLVARAKGYFIRPKYSVFSDLELYVARKLVRAFSRSVGSKRKHLEDSVKKIEDESFKLGLDYRFARGLAHLLYRRVEFIKPKTKIDPLKARLEIFAETSQLYSFALSEDERRDVLEKVSERLNVSTEELLEAFKAAYEEEQIVGSFKEISAEDLLREYNLSLTQTLLFKALSINIDVEVSGTEAKIILFNVKRLSLMYVAEKRENGIRLTIDGPASVLKQTERYGTRIAKLIPYIVALQRWKIFAKVRKQNKIYSFYITDKYSKLFPKIQLRLVEYDSDVEETFYKRFQTLGSGWKIFREPEPLVVGKHIFIPDFAFVKNGVKVYLEIVGFWTKEYLDRKIKKLRSLRDVKIILAVNEELSCSKVFKKEFEDVILYKKKLPAPEVYLVLKKYDPSPATRIKKKTKEKPIRLPEEAETYISGLKAAKLSTVLEKLSKYGLTYKDVVRVLEEKGFEILWTSVDPNRVIVRKRSVSLNSE